MTREEIATILKIIKAAYPNFYKDKSKAELNDILNLWYDLFCEDETIQVASAVKAFIATNSSAFPPPIGAIKQLITKMNGAQELTELQAWGYVSKAIRNSAYNSAEEFKKLPQIIQETIRHPSVLREWALSNADDVSTVIASNFKRSYKASVSSAKEYLVLPSDIKAMFKAAYEPEEFVQIDFEKQKQNAIMLLLEDRQSEKLEQIPTSFKGLKELMQGKYQGETYG